MLFLLSVTIRADSAELFSKFSLLNIWDVDGLWLSMLLLLEPRPRRGGGTGGGLVETVLIRLDEFLEGGGGGLDSEALRDEGAELSI